MSVPGDIPKKRLLVYSHFNGVYVENGTHDGRPKYTEQNKEDGSEFRSTIPAEIRYCQDLESWVFSHPFIRTTNVTDQEVNSRVSLQRKHAFAKLTVLFLIMLARGAE